MCADSYSQKLLFFNSFFGCIPCLCRSCFVLVFVFSVEAAFGANGLALTAGMDFPGDLAQNGWSVKTVWRLPGAIEGQARD